MVFGIGNRPSTPIKSVINHCYEAIAAENIYEGFTPMTAPRDLRSARSTKGNDKRNMAIKASMQEPRKQQFKIKKFTKVLGKTETRRK